MVFVFGSINVDIVIRADSLPVAGETVIGERYELFPGGKGANQAVAAARLGAEVTFAGAVGNDAFAELALAQLRRNGVELSGVRTVDEPTGIATIGVDPSGSNQILVASGANRLVVPQALERLPIGADSLVVLQNELPAETTWQALAFAKARGARTLFNAAPARDMPLSSLKHCDLLVVNEVELVQLCRVLRPEAAIPAEAESLDRSSAAALARCLVEGSQRGVIVTLGEAGAVAVTQSAAWQVEALPVKAIDTTAAGDAFAGALAAALDQGQKLSEALRQAAACGSLACTKAGAQPSLPDRDALAAVLPMFPGAKTLEPV